MGGATAPAIARRSDAMQEACVSVSTSQGIGRRLRTSRRNWSITSGLERAARSQQSFFLAG
eukprot:2966868-Alexandrium_andersonii.AAC.1